MREWQRPAVAQRRQHLGEARAAAEAEAARGVAQFRDLIHRARATTAPNAAMLAQIAGQARVLLGR